MKITGLSQTTCHRLLRKIKKHFKKQGAKRFVSITEFSTYTGIPMQDILRTLQAFYSNKS